MRDMNLNERTLEQRRVAVGLDSDDITKIRALRNLVLENVPALTDTFFAHLAKLEEAKTLMASKELVEQARRMKAEHLAAMVGGDYGAAYAQQRVELGMLYSRARLDVPTFLGAFHHLLRNVGTLVVKKFPAGPVEGFDHFMSLKKVAFVDIGLIVDVLVAERERVIRQQAEAIRELSTPVLQIRDRMLLLPVIGVIDTHRAQLLTESLLRVIRASRAKVAVMDVTGVATIDSKVANHLLQTVAAARLMGTRVIVTGVSSEVAQSLVALGIELRTLNTSGDLQGGIEEAEHFLGYRLVQDESRAIG